VSKHESLVVVVVKKTIEGISNCAENFNNSDLGAHPKDWARR
jgi:hypothetical protein